MANPQKKPTAGAGPTHLVGRSVRKSFRRSGLQFEEQPRYWLIEDLKREWGTEFNSKLRAVMDERMVVARLATADDLGDDARPAVEVLADENAALKAQLAELEARLAALEAPKG